MVGYVMRGLKQNAALVVQLARRDISSRYRGSFGGVIWSIVQPLTMLSIYTFVFTFVFPAKWGVDADYAKGDYALLLLTGMIVHSFFAECLTRAPTLITANPSYVKKLIFPLHVLPVVAIVVATFHAVVSLGVLVAIFFLVKGWPAVTTLLVPFVFMPLVLGSLGVTWAIAGLGVYVRDFAQVTGMVSSVLLFASPVFYPVSALPERIRPLMLLNPLAYVIEDARRVLFFGLPPELLGWSLAMVVSGLVAFAGYWIFQQIRPGFADVL